MIERLMVVMAALILAASGCAGAYEQTSVRATVGGDHGTLSVSYFYEPLSAYGRWVDCGPYGWCWTPYDVAADWRPYDDGRWSYTDAGWAWDSDEPWGWACYHYGRWLYRSDYGWVWVPGEEWAPAWVAWRYGDDWVGWAPLPPEARWQASVGLRFGGAESIPAEHWCFVPQAEFARDNVHGHLAPVSRSVTLLARTRDATRFESRDGRPVDVGVDVRVIERASGRDLPRLKVVDAQQPGPGRGTTMGAGAIGFFRPSPRAPGSESAPRPEWRASRNPGSDPDTRQRWDDERRKLEASLAQERMALERDHDREDQVPPPGVARDELRKRHAAEQRAFEAHAAQARHVLEARWRNQLVKPVPQKESWEPAGRKGGRSHSGNG
jgi:hypothetical protein